ncbi:MAG TPA: hypothetical protein VMW58_11930 [Anaerolineae bacterium]|nr:hypothetical protein [Anaerolineae bacterium]
MSQITRELTDDLVIQLKGETCPVQVGPRLRQTGWRGGQWVEFIEPGLIVDDYLVEVSDGNRVAGFLMFPSENYYENWGATQNYVGEQYRLDDSAPSGSSTVTLCLDGGRYLFWIFETVALTPAGTRTGGPAIYMLNELLKVSENGLLCNDSDVNLNAAGVVTVNIAGRCCMTPQDRNNQRLGLNVRL